ASAAGQGLWLRTMGASTFSLKASPMSPVTALYADGLNNVYAGLQSGAVIENAADGIFNQLVSGPLTSISSLAVNNGTLYATSITSGNTAGHLYAYNSASPSWASVSPGYDARAVAFIDATHVYLATGSGEGVVTGTLGGAFVTKNSGLDNINVSSIASDNIGNFYAVAESQIYRSSDGGATWTSSMSGLASTPSSVMFDWPNGVLYAIGIDTVWKSADHAATWSQVGPALPTPPTARRRRPSTHRPRPTTACSSTPPPRTCGPRPTAGCPGPASR